MTVPQAVLLGVAIALQLVCALGVLLVRDPLQRLHLVGPVSVAGTVLVVAAVLLSATSKTHIAKVVVTGLFVWFSSPFVTRATARALQIRATGGLSAAGEEGGQVGGP